MRDEHQREDEQRRVGEQHEPAAVVRVGERAAEQRGAEQRDELGEPEQADHQRRAREVVDLERDRDVGDHRARERHGLADVEQPELAVPPERADVDRDGAEQAAHGGHEALTLRRTVGPQRAHPSCSR